jgi:WD40 repeat protein
MRPDYSVYRFASSLSGQCLVFSVDQDVTSWDDLLKSTVYAVEGRGEILSTKGHFVTVKGLAVSPDCHQVTVDGIYQQIDPISQKISAGQAGLFLVAVGSTRENAQLIAQSSSTSDYLQVSDAAFGVSWSPKNSLLTYSANGKIFQYSLIDRDTTFLVAGTNPAWSPNGKWLAYRGPDGSPMLLDVATARAEPLVKGAKCIWSIKWSPDSRFAIFTEYDQAGTVFRLCRVQDRATASIYHSGAQYTESRFAWVTRSILAAVLASGELAKVGPE